MAQMKGIEQGLEEFLWVFAIAIVLLVVFMVAGFFYNPSPQEQNQTNATSYGSQIASFQQVGFVGYGNSYAGQDISLGSFTVGQTQAENLRKAGQLDICAGLWCNRAQKLSVDVPSYYMDTIKDVKVSFAVYDTNQYGDLVVKWNGMEFHRARDSAHDYSIAIDKQYVKGSNTLQIYADGPGLAFWASTIYTLRDFRADVEYGPSHIASFALSQGELNAWDSGMLSFIGSGSQGALRIRMNSNQVFQGIPAGQRDVALNFSNSGPKVGENLLIFDALGGGVFSLDNARLKVYLLTNQAVKTKTFQLSEAVYGRLSSGTIRFFVNSVQRDGDMGIKLNGRALAVPKPVAGWNSAHFTKDDVADGTNTLEITGTGYWDIGEMDVNG